MKSPDKTSNKALVSKDPLDLSVNSAVSNKSAASKSSATSSKSYLSQAEISKKKSLQDLKRNLNSSGASIAREDEKTLYNLIHTGAVLSSSDRKISLSERHGARNKEQQDSWGVGSLNLNEDSAKNLKEILKKLNDEMVAKHLFCEKGTTFCSFIFKPDSEKPLSSTITTSNLGDSRLSMIIESDQGKYISISLTKDHNLKNPKILKFIQNQSSDLVIKDLDEEGKYQAVYRKGKEDTKTDIGVSVCGSLGDYQKFHTKAEKAQEYHVGIDFPYNTFDISEIDIEEITKKLRITPKNITLVLACDGVFDVTRDDYQLDENGNLSKRNYELNHSSLAEIKREYDQRTQPWQSAFSRSSWRSLLNPVRDENFAAFLTRKAIKHGSKDNITALCFDVIEEENLKIKQPIIAAVADGHGEAQIYENIEDSNLEENLEKADGSIVSASAIAFLLEKSKAEIIQGLEPQRYVLNFLAYRKAVKTGDIVVLLDPNSSKKLESNLYSIYPNLEDKGILETSPKNIIKNPAIVLPKGREEQQSNSFS